MYHLTSTISTDCKSSNFELTLSKKIKSQSWQNCAQKNIRLSLKQKSSLRGRTSVAKVSDQHHFSILHCLVTLKKKRGGPQCTFSLVTVAQVFTSSSTPTILKKQKTFIEHLFLSNSYTGVYLLMMQPV